MAANNTPGADPSKTEIADLYDDFGLRADWGERVITTVAVALALTVVCAVALLMGMS